MELKIKFISRKDQKKLEKIDKYLSHYNLSLLDLLALKDLNSNLTEKVCAMEKALDELKIKFLELQNETSKRIDDYNKEIIRFTAKNPLNNTSMEEIISSFFQNPNIEIQVSGKENEEDVNNVEFTKDEIVD